MSVRIRPYSKGGWHVDVIVRLPDGDVVRERKWKQMSRTAAQRWGEARERHLLVHGRPVAQKEVPTLAVFAPRFIDEYARANRQKPSGISNKQAALKTHLLPRLGSRRLDEIVTKDIERLKFGLRERKLPRQADSAFGDCTADVCLGRNVSGGFRPRLSCGRSLL